MPFNTSKALSIAAFISSTILIAVAIATIYFSSHADDLLTKAFPPGDYGVNLYYSEETKKGSIRLAYNKSSEIKTLVAAALSLVTGLFGVFAFGWSFKRPAKLNLLFWLYASAALAAIVSVLCAAWSATQEVKIKQSTCNFEPRGPINGRQYTCSIENAACNALRGTDEADQQEDMMKLDTACLEFRHSRYLVIPLAVVSLALAVLYAVRIWIVKRKETYGERAETRVRTLVQGRCSSEYSG